MTRIAGSAASQSPWRRAVPLFIRYGFLPLVMVAMLVAFGAVEPRFVGPANLVNILEQTSFLLVMAVAQMFALLTRGFDLSTGQVVSMLSVVTALIMVWAVQGLGLPPVGAVALGIVCCLALGAVVGLVNGLCITRLGVHPFITTLGMQGVALGVATTISGGFPVFDVPDLLTRVFNEARWLGIPASIFLAIVVCIVVSVVLSRTVFGRALYLIGGNPRSARAAGLRVGLHVTGAYITCSLITAVAAVMLTARTGSGEPMLGGGLMLQSIAAAVIGGVSLRGGEGTVLHCILGAIFITMLSNGMNLAQIDGYMQMIVLGIVVVVGVFIDRLRVLLK
jgi:ribose/xylose/arabinose/galactoside ABC-type transport system permease subunit